MDKKNAIYISVVVICMVLSFKSISNSIPFSKNQVCYDTIHAIGLKNQRNIGDNCLKVANTFYKRFGVLISDYYVVKDSLALDLNGDNVVDTIAILSPISLEVGPNECRFDSIPKRLLVEIIANKNGLAKIRHIYTNLLSNSGGVLSHYSGMYKTNDGFMIIHQAGARYSWQYSMNFSVAKKGYITLRKISKRCTFNGHDKKAVYYYNYLPVNGINVSDTLNLQCNCDKMWMDLEKQ
ncbi:MAG: hypothetical protein Q8908_11385 [Bacteroidota bacterium]|nr:hypothetical protein [Bacteroidota bacterium]